MGNHHRMIGALGAGLVAFGALAPVALADTLGGGHGGVAGQVTGQVQQSGTLPFTGAELGVLVVAALVLLTVGAGLIRLGRKQPAT